jgi:hypothetical protein
MQYTEGVRITRTTFHGACFEKFQLGRKEDNRSSLRKKKEGMMISFSVYIISFLIAVSN